VALHFTLVLLLEIGLPDRVEFTNAWNGGDKIHPMSRGDHLGFAGVVLALVSIGIAPILVPQEHELGIVAFVLALFVSVRWVWISRTSPVESLRSAWLDLETKFKGVHDAAPRPTPGVPWPGGNPHPFAEWDGKHWNLRGENADLKKHMEALCYDAGMLILKSPKLKRTLNASIRRENDPIVRWLKVVHTSEEFTKKFHSDHLSGNRIKRAEAGYIDFLPNVSIRVARRCAAIC